MQNQTLVFNSILEAIGNTPIVKLNRIPTQVLGYDCGAHIYVKCEFMNPGGSIKDRIGWAMIEDAEQRGVLKPGGTIVECTSGNTGVGLAIAAAIKGYKSVFVLPDKMSQEKIKTLRAFGAKVVVTPTAVEPEDPRSYYSVSRRIAEETPNAIHLNQYDNLSNRQAHYDRTGPEIFKQFPQIDGFFAGIGTGGTICGTGKYLKEKKPTVKVVAIDPVGSIVQDVFKHGKPMSPAQGYKIEGIGEDFIPKNYDFTILDDVIQVSDKESFLIARDLLTKEGLYCGISSGSAVSGALKWIKAQGENARGKNYLIILPDTGGRYLSKLFDDDWMREAGFLENPSQGTIQDLLSSVKSQGLSLYTCSSQEKVSAVISKMTDWGISQLPILDTQGRIKGVVSETSILHALHSGKSKMTDEIELLADSQYELVTPSTTIEAVSRVIAQGKLALVQDLQQQKLLTVLTKIDLLNFLGSKF